MTLLKKYIYCSLLILPIISFLGGMWQGQYINDGYHWGFIFSNAIDIIDGKLPYKEIFIQYGVLSTLIHAFILIIFDKNIFSLIAFTCLLYSLSIYIIGVLTYRFTLNKYYSLFSTFVIFAIYPWPTSPWPNFISFFFIVLFCLFYSCNKKIYYILSGISLAFAYLSLTLTYNYIVVSFLLILLFFIFLLRKRLDYIFIQKNIYFFIFFLLTTSIFFLFLLLNNIFDIWLTYQKIPFILADNYEISISSRIIDYIYFITIYSLKNFINEPQWILFTFIFFSNLYLLLKLTLDLFKEKTHFQTKMNLLVINILIFTLNFQAQVGGIEKLATSLSLGIIALLILIHSLKSSDNKIIINFSIIFIVIYSVFFAFDINDSKYAGGRAVHLRDLKNIDEKYNDKNISYFNLQKWSRNTWYPLNNFVELQNKIKKKCYLEFGANLTSNTFYYALLDFKKIQLVPFLQKTHSRTWRKYFEPNLIYELQREINNNNILIVSFENNDRLLDLSNYSSPKKIDLNINSDLVKKFLYIYYPKKCEVI